MREIEVKAIVRDKHGIVNKLLGLGCKLKDPAEQVDQIFLHKTLTYANVTTGIPIARIRTSMGKHIFTVKVPVKNQLDKLESETVVEDPNRMAEALELMDFKKVMIIKKMRQKTDYQGDEICFDEVEGLGSFIEMERLVKESEGTEKIQEELFSFLKNLGIKQEDRISEGYDILIYKASLK